MAGDERQLHMARCSQTEGTGGEEKCVYAHPEG